jgi:hypothetical protein
LLCFSSPNLLIPPLLRWCECILKASYSFKSIHAQTFLDGISLGPLIDREAGLLYLLRRKSNENWMQIELGKLKSSVRKFSLLWEMFPQIPTCKQYVNAKWKPGFTFRATKWICWFHLC